MCPSAPIFSGSIFFIFCGETISGHRRRLPRRPGGRKRRIHFGPRLDAFDRSSSTCINARPPPSNTPFMSPSIHNPRMVRLIIVLRTPSALGANDMLPSRTTSVCCPLVRHGHSVYHWRRDRICPHTFYPINRRRNWVRIIIFVVSWFV